MEENLLEKISCKYIIKSIFSYIKEIRALKIIKINKKLIEKCEIDISTYQTNSLYNLFKNTKINNIHDILNFPYLDFFPENIKNRIVSQIINEEKFFNDYIYINVDDIKSISFLLKLEKEQKKDFKYIIGYKEKKHWDDKELDFYHYQHSIIDRITTDKNLIKKILFNYSLLVDEKEINGVPLDFKSVKNLNINSDIYRYFNDDIYDITSFENLEYLSISIDDSFKLILSEKQFKNIKVLKIYESYALFRNDKAINISNININEDNKFLNLTELYIKEKHLNNIHFVPENLKKLDLIYDTKDQIYTIEYIKNSLSNLIGKYLSLIDFNIYFFFKDKNIDSFSEFVEEMSDFYFNLNKNNLKNISFDFYRVVKTGKELENFYSIKSEIIIKNIRDKKEKYKLLVKNAPIYLFETYYNKIEDINLLSSFPYEFESPFSYFNKRKKSKFLNLNNDYNFTIEENNLNSSIKNLVIESLNSNDNNTIPIQSYSSLNFLKLSDNNFIKNFHLFYQISPIKYNNLEYLSINFINDNDYNTNFFENLQNIPNLRFLSIINKNFSKKDFSYIEIIISKCALLKKLHTLILTNEASNNTKLDKVEEYFPDYPELKKTNIKFCYIFNSKNIK